MKYVAQTTGLRPCRPHLATAKANRFFLGGGSDVFGSGTNATRIHLVMYRATEPDREDSFFC